MKKLKQAVILNGPPGSGKDTIADAMVMRGFTKHEFKDRLYKDTAETFGVDARWFREVATCRENKERPSFILRVGDVPVSPRRAMIITSEMLIKPQYGVDYFGEAAARSCVELGSQYAVFSDGGFIEEIAPLSKIYDRVTIIHLYRDGYSFDGDSRSYIKGLPHTYAVENNSYVGEAVDKVLSISDAP